MTYIDYAALCALVTFAGLGVIAFWWVVVWGPSWGREQWNRLLRFWRREHPDTRLD